MLYGLNWIEDKVTCQINLYIPKDHFVYTCHDLHTIPHGDENMQSKPKADSVLKASGVAVVNISTSSSVEQLNAYYPESELTSGIASYVGDVNRLQQQLFHHLFERYQAGMSNGSRDSNAARVDFGISLQQPTSRFYSDSRSGLVLRLPFCNLKPFMLMNDVLKTDLSNLLLYFHQQVNRQKGHQRKCNDDKRSELVHDLFQKNGWIFPFVGFEYINLSLRSNEDTLNKHFDSLNDRRRGYNHAAVYSFLYSHCNRTYRAVIVMTFRNIMGCFLDKLRQLPPTVKKETAPKTKLTPWRKATARKLATPKKKACSRIKPSRIQPKRNVKRHTVVFAA